ncbi:C-C chemokine receptor type 1-like [Phascolarctos cinereus]|uniref:C-C chemokine receptor type 1-like n=1 Tax=Phascolarctos cinereus TaxID=38626 RepID=A0A6P5KBT6_PHACI|nr:C-C chemokine receptor type 1-like [Phascolarctos cinereus]XP_020842971.1 C-C chemokine receptor type 1-like [Phascolarctos cinereus]XP_020842972.1 C-C chemokine receptor type 1-like [Phascolarctos cinereus]
MSTSTALLDPTTTEYYYYDGDAAPCHKDNVKELTSMFLPPLYVVVFIIGLLGNAMVVLILMKYKRLKTMTNIYLFNLAISDLLFLITLPFWIHYELQRDWVFGDAMCKLLSGLYYLGLYSEILFIILLTIDRYLAIVHAVFAIKVRKVVLSIVTSIMTWGVAFLASLPDIIFTRSQKEFFNYSCSPHFPHETARTWRQFQALKLNILALILPLLVMIFCYTGIIKILLRRRSEKKWKAVKLIFVIMVIFFLFWTPYNLTVLVSAFQDVFFTTECERSKQLDLAMQVTEVIAFTHCCVNPVIYAFVGERFQKYLSHFVHNHVAVHLCKHVPSFLRDRLERASSFSPSTGEQELSVEF